MYAIIFRQSVLFKKKGMGYGILERNLPTLEVAKEKRMCSGDIVVHQSTMNVVDNMDWLWDWEKKNPKSYAHMVVKEKIQW